MTYLTRALLTFIALALAVLAYYAMREMLVGVPPQSEVKTSFENVVVILLTTVTIIFTLVALIIAILGFYGAKAIKEEAGKFAERAVIDAVEEALSPEGKATLMMNDKFPPNDGPIKDWMEERIERQVISLLPLIMDRMNLTSDVGPVDPSEPDDEGTTD